MSNGRVRGPYAPGWLALITWLSTHAGGCDSAPTSKPAPPSGGQEYVMSFETFEETIHPILVQRGCNAAGDCHGGGIRGTFELSPPGEPDVAFDFDQATLQVTPHATQASPLLTKPLAQSAGGEPHSYEPFESTGDPDYRAILEWIDDGELR